MIALVSGTVAVRRADHVVVDCGGVGYRLAVSSETLRHVPAVGNEVVLHTHLVVRDDALALYGFATEEERELFLMLLGVQSVGPEGRAGGALGRPAARAAGGRSPPATRRGSRPRRGSASAPPSGSSSSCARRSATRCPADDDHGSAARPTTRARSPARAARSSATARQEVDELLDGAAGERAEELIAHALRSGPPMSSPAERGSRRPRSSPEDELDRSLRPRRLEDFVGQEAVKDQLAVSIAAAASRGEALDHVLLAGPPGLGKTSLAQIVAAELDVPFVQTAGPALERKGDIARFLTALEPRAVFFVDEIHRLPRALEETFYPAMEDRRAADHRRPGRRRAGRDAAAAAVHADRRDHAHRAC